MNIRYLSLILLSLLVASCSGDEPIANSGKIGQPTTQISTPTPETQPNNSLTLLSLAIENSYLLDDYKCEKKDKNNSGAEASIPLSWMNIPRGANSIAITMHHYPKEETGTPNSYLLLWGIDTNVTQIAYGEANNGSWYMGANKDGNAISYTSPCSQGAGEHKYTLTLYALDKYPEALPKESTLSVTYDVLIKALDEVVIIDKTTLEFTDKTVEEETTQSEEDITSSFTPLDAFPNVSLSSDENYYYMSSNGLPSHSMMIGITSWQQQVPLPQDYRGANAWAIKKQVTPALSPLSLKTNFYKGAVGIALDGVPIFNPLNNRGEDAYLAGELDEFGGHSGRADDYHYHIAPTYINDASGDEYPIAFMLDGYPLYGYKEPNTKEGVDYTTLDESGGHDHNGLGYHYHASKAYPYINSQMHGEVVVENDNEGTNFISPQASTTPIRKALEPLRGANVTGFTQNENATSFSLTYSLNTSSYTLKYERIGDEWVFSIPDHQGDVVEERYSAVRGGERPPPPPAEPIDEDFNRIDSNISNIKDTSVSPLPRLLIQNRYSSQNSTQEKRQSYKMQDAGHNRALPLIDFQ